MSSVENVCTACQQELAEGVRCHAESYGLIIDREGRHFGECWAGRFPTEKAMEEWRASLAKKRAGQGPPAPPPLCDIDTQLHFDLIAAGE